MNEKLFANDRLAVVIRVGDPPSYRAASLALRRAGSWQRLIAGIEGHEFATSVAACDASTCEADQTPDGGWEIRLTARCEFWSATSVITVPHDRAHIFRRQTYHFLRPCTAAI